MLKKPLTQKSIRHAFAALKLSSESVRIYSVGSEATVDGEWSRSELLRVFKQLGFSALDGGYAFVNKSATIGISLQGVSIDPSANRFLTFSFEIQARSLFQARAHHPRSALMLFQA